MDEESGGNGPPLIKSKSKFDNQNEKIIEDCLMEFSGFSNKDKFISSQIEHKTQNKKTSNSEEKIDKNDVQKNKDEIFYTNNASGPFVVIIESGFDNNINLGKYNYMKIARDIFELKLTNIIRIRNKGNHKIGIEFDNYLAANACIKNKYILDKGYKIYIPYNLVTCKGIVRRVDPELEIKDLKYLIQSKYKILDIKRLNRKVIENDTVEFKPTGTLLITFEGTNLPKHINVSYISFPVLPYVSRVTQCFKCQFFGHTEVQCKGKRRCVNCSEIHDDDQEYSNCKKIKCFHCKSFSHIAKDKNCPEYIRQKNIKEKMAFDNLSFFDAALFFPKPDYLNKNGDNVVLFRGNDFPSLGNNSKSKNREKIESISVKDRAQAHFNNLIKTKRSFAMVSQDNNRLKKRIVQDKSNNNSINEILVNPNGRISQSGPNRAILHQQDKNEAGSSKGYGENYNFDMYEPLNRNKKTFVPKSATEKSIELCYKNFLELNDNDKNKLRESISSYFRLLDIQDIDNLSDTY